MSTEGRLFDGKFRILDQIAQGDLASVYQATDVESGKVCTLKLFNWELSSDESFMSNLKHEADKVEKLRHPNIMPAGKVEQTHKGQVYAVREFIEGRNLEDVIRLEAPLNLRRVCTIGRQIASALEASHNAGILHGDLKPSNILLFEEESAKETVKVLGFGSFSLKRDRFMDLAHLALHDPNRLIGSAQYISPERAIGTEPDALDGRSDLYSLGVILYEMLSGETPFRGSNPMEALLEQLFDEPRPLRGRPDLEIPEVLDTLVMRTLAKRRKDRPASATVLVDQLQAWEKYEGAPEAPAAETAPGDDAMVSANEPAAEPEPASRLPFVYLPKGQVEDSAPTVQRPLRATVGQVPETGNPEPGLLWSFSVASHSEPGGAPSVDFPAPTAKAETLRPKDLPVEAIWSSTGTASSEPQGPAPGMDFPAPPTTARTPQAESPEPELERQTSFIADVGTAQPVQVDQATVLKMLGNAAESTSLEHQPAEAHTFVADLGPENPIEAAEGASKTIADTGLGGSASSEWPVTSTGADMSGGIGSVIFTQDELTPAAPRARRGHAVALASILVILVAGGGGGGWLYYTGRSYWFQPHYVIQRVSSLLSSDSPGGTPSAQPSGTPASPTPASSPQPLGAQAQPSASSAVPPSHSGAVSHAANLPASAPAPGTHNPTPALKAPSPSQALKRLPAHQSEVKLQPPRPESDDSPAVEDAIRRGSYYFLLGRYDAAIRVYDTALKQNPSNPKLLEEIAKAKRAKTAEAEFLGH